MSTKKEVWKCPKCPLKFAKESYMKEHNKKVHMRLKPFGCPQCSRKFLYPSLVRNHIQRSHLKLSRFHCPVCGQGFFYRCSMENHRVEQHGVEALEEVLDTPIGQFQKVNGVVIGKKSKVDVKIEEDDDDNEILNEYSPPPSPFLPDHPSDDTDKQEKEEKKDIVMMSPPQSPPVPEPSSPKDGSSGHNNKDLDQDQKPIRVKVTFPCFACSKKFPSRMSMRQHCKQRHGVCPQNYVTRNRGPSRAKLTKPTILHSFKCTKCTVTCVDAQALLRHIRRHEGIQPAPMLVVGNSILTDFGSIVCSPLQIYFTD